MLYAKSAATLISIGADTLTLHELAQLGPLDTQTHNPHATGGTEPRYVSALNDFKGLEELRQFVAQTLETVTRIMLEQRQLPVGDAVRHAIDVVRVTSEPLFSKIDPEKLGTSRRALTIGIEYGKRVLQRANAEGKQGNWLPTATTKSVDQVISRLVYEYPSHDFIIDQTELQDIGFHQAGLFQVQNDEERAIIRELFGYIAIRDERDTVIRLVDPIIDNRGDVTKISPETLKAAETNGALASSSRETLQASEHRVIR